MTGFTAQDVIFTYDRASALADGVLVDVDETATEAGLKYHTALTRAAWEDCVAWTAQDTEATGHPQDEAGRLWDVLFMARCAIASAPASTSRVTYTLDRVHREAAPGDEPQLQTLAIECHGGDCGEPVLTISLPGED